MEYPWQTEETGERSILILDQIGEPPMMTHGLPLSDRPGEIEARTFTTPELPLHAIPTHGTDQYNEQLLRRSDGKRRAEDGFDHGNAGSSDNEAEYERPPPSKKRKAGGSARNNEPERPDSLLQDSPSSPSPRRHDQRNMPYASIEPETKERRKAAIKVITGWWGVDWHTHFSPAILPRGLGSRARLHDPKDWSTSVLKVLEDLSEITPKDVARVADRMLREASERKKTRRGFLELVVADVKAVIMDVMTVNERHQTDSVPPGSSTKTSHTKHFVHTPTHASGGEDALLAGASHNFEQLPTPSSPAPEVVDRPIKLESDGSVHGDMKPSLHESDDEDKELIQANFELAQAKVELAEAKVTKIKRRVQQRAHLRAHGHAADAAIEL